MILGGNTISKKELYCKECDNKIIRLEYDFYCNNCEEVIGYKQIKEEGIISGFVTRQKKYT